MANSNTTTAATGPAICVAPLSSPYTFLPRLHTYGLVLTLLLPLPRGWLFRAALAAFTARTAVFIVDACVLLNRAKSSFSLEPAAATLWPDALVGLSALSLAAVVSCWLLLVSRRGAESSARALVRAWAVAAGVGCVLSFQTVADIGRLAAAAVAAAPSREAAELEPCHHSVRLGVVSVFGGPVAVPVLGVIGSNIAWFTQRVGIPGLLFSVLTWASVMISKPRTAANDTVAADVSLGTSAGHRLSSSDTGFDNAYLEENKPPEPEPTEISQDGASWSHLSWAFSMFNTALVVALPAMAALIAISTEQFFHDMAPSIPPVENMDSVGQWGVWAATAVVALGTLINAIRERMGFASSILGKGD